MRLEYILRFCAVVLVCLCSRCAARFLPKNQQFWSTFDESSGEESSEYDPLQKTDLFSPEDGSIGSPISHRVARGPAKRSSPESRYLRTWYIPFPRRRATVRISYSQIADFIKSLEGKPGLKMNSLKFGRR